MQKTLKRIGIGVAVLLGILVIAAVVLTLVFDPNQYKPEIIKLVKDKTGRELRIDKKIGWSFFPRLGIEAGGVELANAPGFGKEPFARVEAAGVHVAFLPLLRGTIDVNRIYLHGVDLNLAKDKNGRTNWDDLTAGSTAKPAAEPAKPEGSKLPLEGLSIGQIEVKRANLNWRDAQSGNSLAIHNFELATSRFVANQPMDLKLGFELVRDQAAPVKIALNSRLTAASDSLKLAQVDLKLDDSRLTGDIDVHHFASPALRFDLALDQINLDRYLGGEKAAEPKAAKTAAPAPANPAPHAALRSLNIDGKLNIKKVQVIGLQISDIQTQLKAHNGLLALSPTTAKLYGGSLKGETVVDARGNTAQIRVDEKLEQVQVGPLLKDMKVFDSFSGTGNVALNLTAQGLDARQVRSSLSGNGSVSLRDGRIEGVDLDRIYQSVQEAREKKSSIEAIKNLPQLAPKKDDSTQFGEMTGTFQAKNGLITNRDLRLRTRTLVATGIGGADLARGMMDYRLALSKEQNIGAKCKSLPLRIHGPLLKLKYEPDYDLLLKCEAEKKLKQSTDQLLKGKLKGLFK